MTFPILERVRSLGGVPAEAAYMHSVVVGRNDNDLPDPVPIEEEVDAFLDCRGETVEQRWATAYFEGLGIDPEPPALLKGAGVSTVVPSTAVALVDHTMDHPTDLHRFAAKHFAGRYELVAKRKPASVGVDFLGARKFDAQVAELMHEALVDCFQAKYFFARLRPEHFFKAGRLVTTYRCPPHPAYPAGHGAIAGATLQAWRVLTVAEDSVYEELELAAQHFAHYRTLAGVHWPTDNSAGFDSGVATVRRKLRSK